MQNMDRFRDYLKQGDLLMTRERLIIAEIVCNLDTPFKVEKLQSLLKEKNVPVSPATVYRNVRLLAKAGIIENLNWSHSGKSLFRKLEFKPISCTIECTICDCKHAVSNDKLEEGVLQLCREFNMEQTGIVVNIRGRIKENYRHNKKTEMDNDA